MITYIDLSVNGVDVAFVLLSTVNYRSWWSNSIMVAPFGFYESQLFVLTAYCICSLLLERHISARKRATSISGGVPQEEGRGPGWKMSNSETSGYPKLSRSYLLVYAIVMGADWLQVSSTLVALPIRPPDFSDRRDHTSTPYTTSNTSSRNAPSPSSSSPGSPLAASPRPS